MPEEKQSLSFMIRQATEDDTPGIRQVNRLAWESAYATIYTPDEIQRVFEGSLSQRNTWADRRQDRISTLVAEANGEIIGMVGLSKLHDGDGEITHLYVHPQYQKQGVGYALWRAGIEALQRRRCKKVWVWVLAKAAAYQFYLRYGCEPMEMGSYYLGEHEEKTIGCVLDLSETTYPAWLPQRLVNNTFAASSAQGHTTTMPNFLGKYTLHDSEWLGMWIGQAMSQLTIVVDWDIAHANWKTRRIDIPDGEPAYLVMQFSKIYHIITNDIESNRTVIDRVESHQVTDVERKVWSQLITAQTLVSNESVDYILDETLHQTSIIGIDGDIIHLFHTESVKFLCLNSDGDTITIPNLSL